MLETKSSHWQQRKVLFNLEFIFQGSMKDLAIREDSNKEIVTVTLPGIKWDGGQFCVHQKVILKDCWRINSVTLHRKFIKAQWLDPQYWQLDDEAYGDQQLNCPTTERPLSEKGFCQRKALIALKCLKRLCQSRSLMKFLPFPHRWKRIICNWIDEFPSDCWLASSVLST